MDTVLLQDYGLPSESEQVFDDSAELAVKQNGDRLLRLAVTIMGNKSDAEDVVQDVFVKLIEKQPRFSSQSHQTAWLITVTKNLCKTRLRSHSRKNAELSDELLEIYPARDNSQRELIEAVMALPMKYRLVIHLFYYEGYTSKEIAAMTKQKDSTVREQLTRARRTLKKYLEEDNES